MRFWVSVPVLSVQITVVLPSVSAAGSLRMMACRRAILDTPIASVMVTAAGRPSGMAPTASATAAVTMSAALSPRATPMAKTSAARPRITTVSQRLNTVSFWVSGVVTPAAWPTSWWIRPISVSTPVATASPAP